MTAFTGKDRVIVRDKTRLMTLISDTIAQEGPFCDLNFLDVSRLKDFKGVFYRSTFLGDISEWDMSSATELGGMFEQSKFNGDISKWNVSNVVSMVRVFNRSQFDGDISNWDTGRVTTMDGLFWSGKFNRDISGWNTSSVTNMANMFESSPFTGDLSKWDVSKVTSMSSMFANSPFDSDISNWNVSGVTDFSSMFAGAIFQGQVANWDTSAAIDMSSMFAGSAYRSHLSDVSKWNVQRVLSFQDMWNASDVPRDLSAWRFSARANTDNLLGGQHFSECDRPSEFHWRRALEPVFKALLRPQDQAFFDRNRAMVESLCDSTAQAAAMLQKVWLQEHGLAPPAAETIALPDLDSNEGIGV